MTRIARINEKMWAELFLSLIHIYSKIIHEMLCGYRYDLCPLPTEEVARAFLTRRQFKAINVTIPYKRLVMEYCTYIDRCV